MPTPIEFAKTQLDVKEATNRNDGVPAERYMRGDALAWCAGLCLWCLTNAGDKIVAPTVNLYYFCRKVSNFVKRMKTLGLFHEPKDFVPSANDIIFFGNTASDVGVQGSHVGLVEFVKDGRVHTIEGNTSNRVARRSYPLDDKTIVGYGRLTAFYQP